MHVSVKGAAIAGGLLWGGAILLVELINLVFPNYGLTFLQMVGSVYPWFHPSHTAQNVIVGTLEGFLDGALAACFLAWLYNRFSGVRKRIVT